MSSGDILRHIAVLLLGLFFMAMCTCVSYVLIKSLNDLSLSLMFGPLSIVVTFGLFDKYVRAEKEKIEAKKKALLHATSKNTKICKAKLSCPAAEALNTIKNIVETSGSQLKSIKIIEIVINDRDGKKWKKTGNKIISVESLEIHLELSCKNPYRKLHRILSCHTEQLQKTSSAASTIDFRWSGSKHELRDTRSEAYQTSNFLIQTILAELKNQSLLLQSPFSRQSVKVTKTANTKSAEYTRAETAAYSIDEAETRWPTAQDFLEAVQNPQQNLSDGELKAARTELNILGLPKVASGMFASVYQLVSDTKSWAVRCFNDPPGDNHERYQAVSHFILSDDLPYTVDFAYIKEGIRLEQIWYPIVKMNWVEGVPLNLFIDKHLDDKTVLTDLRAEFRKMVEKLQENGIAHGDLQHGNILVSEGEIYLVDYDAFYVPELAGKKSKELGHANYQHPARSAEHFGNYLDNFSAHIIDLSLLCLIEEPELWEKFEGGDECILFRQQDFLSSKKSPLFNHLLNHKNSEIKEAASAILAYLEMDPVDIPPLAVEKGERISLKVEQHENKLADA